MTGARNIRKPQEPEISTVWILKNLATINENTRVEALKGRGSGGLRRVRRVDRLRTVMGLGNNKRTIPDEHPPN